MNNQSALFQAIYAAIFDPSSLQGDQGCRTTTEWQADAVIATLQKFYPHIEQVYAGHLQRINTIPLNYHPVEALLQLSDTLNDENLDSIDTTELSSNLEEIAHRIETELSHRDALLDTAILVQGAVIQLLNSNDVFIGTQWVNDINNENRLGQPALYAHVWSYGEDTEAIPAEKLLFLADLIRQFGHHAIQAWVCYVRGWAKPIKGELDDGGRKALSYLNSLSTPTETPCDENDADISDDFDMSDEEDV